MNVSICIPTFNNESTILSVLNSAKSQTYTAKDIFIFDDCSTDDTTLMLSDAKVNIVTHSKNLGRGAVRNAAIEHIDTEFILFCDATNLLPPNFVSKAIQSFKNSKVAAVSGRIINEKKLNGIIQNWRARHLFKENFDFGNELLEATSLTTYGTMLRKSAVLDVGNFNQDLRHSEDRELGQRLIKAGFKIIGDPNLVVYSIKKDSIWSVLERYWRWYGGEYESMSFGDYVRSIRGSFRPMIQQDINDCDWGAALISLICPHYGYIRHLSRKIFSKLQKLN